MIIICINRLGFVGIINLIDLMKLYLTYNKSFDETLNVVSARFSAQKISVLNSNLKSPRLVSVSSETLFNAKISSLQVSTNEISQDSSRRNFCNSSSIQIISIHPSIASNSMISSIININNICC